MKFIISGYSPNMIQATDFSLDWHQVSEEEFQALISFRKQARSYSLRNREVSLYGPRDRV